MKNPIIIVSESFGTYPRNIVEAATLHSCFDHIGEDLANVEQDVSHPKKDNSFETPGMQEIE